MNALIKIFQPIGTLGFETAKTYIVKEKSALVCITLCAASALALAAYAYKRLYGNDTLPFDNWKVCLGISSRQSLPAGFNPGNLADLAKQYTPTQLTQMIYAFVENQKKSDTATSPQSHEEWLASMTDSAKDKNIPWGYEKNPGRPEEEERAISIQYWMSTLQDWAIFAGLENLYFSGSLLQSIQRSPRLAYSILFNFIAPITAPAIWDTIKESVPEFIKTIGEFYIAHSVKFAFAVLAGMFLLHRYSQRERGVLTNLTNQWEQLRGSHRGFDQAPSYRQSIDEILCQIGSTKRGERGSNILCYYHEDTHSTFGGMTGDVLAELSATGRLYNDKRTPLNFPELKDLQIWELNLENFLTEYPETNDVFRGWRQMMGNIGKEKNVLVVIKGFSQIEDIMIPPQGGHHSPGGAKSRELVGGKTNGPETALNRLVSQSIRLGHFRCILEMDEDKKKEFEKRGEPYPWFSPVRSKSVSTAELIPLFKNLFSRPDSLERVPEQEIEEWLNRLEPALEKSPQHPQDLIDTVHDAIRKVEVLRQQECEDGDGSQNWHQKLTAFREAESNLKEVLKLKGELLQKIWKQRKECSEIQKLNDVLAVVEKATLPLFAQLLEEAKKELNPDLNYRDVLISTVQKRFHRLFGPCTGSELARLNRLPETLKHEIIGQDLAIKTICKAITNWRRRPDMKGKPLVLFFAGPTGVGKSETGTQLGYHLNAVFDVAEEYTKNDEHNVKRVQLGHKEQGGVFGWDLIRSEILGHILANPISVIIFEEWDKMNEKEKNQLNELFEDTNLYLTPRFNSSSGAEPVFVDRSSTIFILTSNVAMDTLNTPSANLKADVEAVTSGINGLFDHNDLNAKAFLSRLDAIIPFHGISNSDFLAIMSRNLDDMQRRGYIEMTQRQQAMNKLEQKVNSKESWDVREAKRLMQEALTFDEIGEE